MEKRFKESNQTVNDVETIRYVFDIKTWIAPHLEEIHNHTTPHIFALRRNINGKAALFYKAWSQCKWEPHDGNGLVLLKVMNV